MSARAPIVGLALVVGAGCAHTTPAETSGPDVVDPLMVARLAEAGRDDQGAFDAWVAALARPDEAPWRRRYAALGALRLVDRVPLDAARATAVRRALALTPTPSLDALERAIAQRLRLEPAPAFASGDAPAARRAEVPEAASGLVARLARLELALDDGDPDRADAAARALEADGADAAAVELARFELSHAARPSALSRDAARRRLEVSLSATPRHADARALLVALLVADGAREQARSHLAGEDFGDALPWLLHAVSEPGSPEAALAARALRQALPSSCRAWELAMDELAGAALGPGAPPVPRCPPIALRAARLDAEAGRVQEAEQRLRRLAEAGLPGPLASEVAATRVEVALRRRDLAAARAHAEEGLAAGGDRSPLLQQLARLADLGDDSEGALRWRDALRADPDAGAALLRPTLRAVEDLGLPLADGQAIAAAAIGRWRAGERAAAPVEVLHDDHHLRVLPGGAQVHRVHRLFQILDEGAAASWGEVALPDEVELLAARTWKPTPDGRPQPIEAEDLADTGAISLTALQPGAVGEVAWIWLEEPSRVLWPAWRTPLLPLERADAAVRRARVTVHAPEGAEPLVLDVTGEPDASGHGWVEVRDRPRVPREPLDPRPDRRRVGVRVSRGLSVEALVERYREAAAVRVAPSPDVRRLAARALSEVPAHRLEALYALVVDEVRDGGGGVWAGSAAATAATGAGDRAVLLVSLCRVRGLRCSLALARPRSRGVPDPHDAPAVPEDWTYTLVRAELDGEALWLDPSSPFAPFGLLPPLVQGVQALNLGEGPAVVRTPLRPGGLGERRVVITLDVAADGTWTARGAESIDGLFGLGWREALAPLASDPRRRVLRGVVGRMLPQVEAVDVEVEAVAGRELPLVLRWQARGRLQPVSEGDAGGHLALALSPEDLAESTARLPSRRTPLWVNQAARLVLDVEIILPPGWRATSLPAPVLVEEGAARCERVVEASGTPAAPRLTVRKRLRLDPARIAPEDYPVWVQAATAIDASDRLRLTVGPGDGGGP